MADHVLDLIDSVLDDYATSADAMRWAPDAPDPTPSGEVVPFAQVVLGEPLTPWQAWAVGAAGVTAALAAATRPCVAAVDEFFRAAAAEFSRCGEQVAVVFDEINVAEAEQRARLRRMHTEYSRRRR